MLPFDPPWPLPADFLDKPGWWITPPFPEFPYMNVIGENIACKLMDEEAQEIQVIIASRGINIEEDEKFISDKIKH